MAGTNVSKSEYLFGLDCTIKNFGTNLWTNLNRKEV